MEKSLRGVIEGALHGLFPCPPAKRGGKEKFMRMQKTEGEEEKERAMNLVHFSPVFFTF